MCGFISGLSIQLHSTICFCDNIILLQNRVWNRGVWCLKVCSSFSRLLWLLEVFFGPTQILEFLVPFLWKMLLEFWLGLYLICGLLWLVQTWTLLILPTHEDNYLSIYLCFLQLLSLMSCSFQCIGPEHWWLNVILNILFFFDTTVNGIVFLILLIAFLKYSNFIYLFLAVLGLCCYTGISLVVVNGGYSLSMVHRFLTAAASVIAEHRLHSPQACGLQQLWLPGSTAQVQ